jgi:hypothetical protein
MSDNVISFENIFKLYRLVEVVTGSLAHDVRGRGAFGIDKK